MFQLQVKTLVRKNFTSSFRSRELFVDMGVPIIIAIMLSLKEYLGVLNQIMPIVFALSITGTSRSIMIQLVHEKSQRYKETQKIMGMSNSAYLTGWFVTAYIRMALAVTTFIFSSLIFNSLFGLDFERAYTCSFGMLSTEFIIYAFTAINQSFLYASLFNDTKLVGEVSTLFTVAFTFFIYMTYLPAAAGSPWFFVIIGIITPQCNCAFGYVSALHGFQGGYYNLFPPLISETYSIGAATGQLASSFVLNLVLFLYCDQVIPNEYGIAKPPLFFLQWFKAKKLSERNDLDAMVTMNTSLTEIIDLEDSSSALYHEQIKMEESPTIRINSLYKEFGSLKAVNYVSLNLYESQIFCLLGHNGAGKTTTISLLTGLIKKTSGKVTSINFIFTNEQCTDMPKIRTSLGLCTQKDCLYDSLTVAEHLAFIGGIKGGISLAEINSILDKTDLRKEQEKEVRELSGGSKRKLSLAMALVGNSKIVFLDEPTSGMDAYSRRAIWDILERIKEDKRTIILTTHHLDEAEILADRIGIMTKGQLLAVGTSEFIKKKFGEGYNLKLGVAEQSGAVRKTLIELLGSAIPESSLIEEQTTSEVLSFLVPFSSQGRMERIFKEIEEMGNIKISMQMNTLEDAFINIGMDEEKAEASSKSDLELQGEKEPRLQEAPACLSLPPRYDMVSQLYAVFLRRLFTTIRTDTNVIALVIPLISFFLGVLVVNYMTFPTLTLFSYPQVQENVRITMLGITCIIGFSFNSAAYIVLPVQERELKLKQVLCGMGLRIAPYWLGTFIFDIIMYSALIVFYLVVAACFGLTAVTDYLGETIFVFISFSMCYIPYAYFAGFIFNTTDKALRLFSLFNFFVTFCMPLVFLAMLNFLRHQGSPDFWSTVAKGFQFCFMFSSPYWTFIMAYQLIAGPAQFQFVSKILGAPVIITDRYWVFCLALMVQGKIYTALVYYFEVRNRKKKIVIDKKFEYPSNLEDDVKNEYQRVLTSPQSEDSARCVLLEKQYTKQGPQVLQKTTFGVKQGQILGIIGPNGAGKSTILNIFTGLTKATGGRALLKNRDVQLKEMDVLEHVGICAQFDCIWDNLTPLEHLQLFGRIKGLSGFHLQQSIDYFIETMQLSMYTGTKAGRLSGGNKRKLCVADALIGGSDITFFDEPSTGVDPIARRFLFSTLKRNVQLRNCSVIMTTHTIEEAEALSETIGILICGQFMCLGSPEYLRKTYGSGYQLSIKYTQASVLTTLQREIEDKFPGIKQLEDKRPFTLTYSVSDKDFSFYRTFQYFEQKKKSGAIEEFSINQRYNNNQKLFQFFGISVYSLLQDVIGVEQITRNSV